MGPVAISRFEIEHGYTPCPFTFGESPCGYAGEARECAKTIEDCRKHGQIKRFGGYPSSNLEVIATRCAVRLAETLARWREEDGEE